MFGGLNWAKNWQAWSKLVQLRRWANLDWEQATSIQQQSPWVWSAAPGCKIPVTHAGLGAVHVLTLTPSLPMDPLLAFFIPPLPCHPELQHLPAPANICTHHWSIFTWLKISCMITDWVRQTFVCILCHFFVLHKHMHIQKRISQSYCMTGLRCTLLHIWPT